MSGIPLSHTLESQWQMPFWLKLIVSLYTYFRKLSHRSTLLADAWTVVEEFAVARAGDGWCRDPGTRDDRPRGTSTLFSTASPERCPRRPFSWKLCSFCTARAALPREAGEAESSPSRSPRCGTFLARHISATPVSVLDFTEGPEALGAFGPLCSCLLTLNLIVLP